MTPSSSSLSPETANKPAGSSPLSGQAFLSLGLRPFFPGAALWAAGAMLAWIAWLTGLWSPPTALDPVTWHTHAMVFGFAGAAVFGFLLTAVPSWTGQQPVKGTPLLGLFLLWAAARVALLVSERVGLGLAVILDVGVLLLLALWTVRAVWAGRNRRNAIMPALITVLAIASGLHLGPSLGAAWDAGLGLRLGLVVFALLVGLVGGRIVPAFTRNWLTARGETRLPASTDRLDAAGLLVLAIAGALWVFLPEAMMTGVALALASILSGLRLSRWRGLATGRDSLLMMLHVAFAWLPAALALLALAVLTGGAIPQAAGIHALGAGAFATLILAVMMRATLGHTGRPLKAAPWMTALFWMLTLAALARVAHSLWPALGTPVLHASAGLWMLGFAGFVIGFGPMVLRPRTDGGA